MDPLKENLLAQFVSVTNASQEIGSRFLADNDWDLEEAIGAYFAFGGESDEPSSSRSGQNNVRTFSQLNDKDDEDTNLFTGGEKSGLEVENPDKKDDPFNLVNDLLRKAQETASQPDDRPSAKEQKKKRSFKGTGYKLGDETGPSQRIPDPTANVRPVEKVTRQITFWKDGFSVGDGPLFRYDDQANASYLNDLNSGRAPLNLLNVQWGQEVDVNVDKKLDEMYKPPKRKVGGFSGQGQRLGSPVPGEVQISAPVEKQEEKKEETDNGPQYTSTGDSSVQIRLASGKRLVHKFNSSDSVSELFNFVEENTVDRSRRFMLSLAYPIKPIENLSQSIKEAGLVNAVIVQRWV